MAKVGGDKDRIDMRRKKSDRRVTERRNGEESVTREKRSGIDRRTGTTRRTGLDRRIDFPFFKKKNRPEHD